MVHLRRSICRRMIRLSSPVLRHVLEMAMCGGADEEEEDAFHIEVESTLLDLKTSTKMLKVILAEMKSRRVERYNKCY